MKKKLYETPRTQHVEVELEEGVMTGGSVFLKDDDSEDLPIENQKLGNEFNFSDGNTENGNGWDL